MSEFESVYIINEFINSLQGRLETFVTGLFAMLVTSYFVGSKLSRLMAAGVIGLFTLFSALLGYATISAALRLRALAEEMQLRYSDELAWLFGSGPALDPTLPLIVLLIAAYLAAVWFFVKARKQ